MYLYASIHPQRNGTLPKTRIAPRILSGFQGLFWVWQVSKECLQRLCLCFSVLSSLHTGTNHFTSRSAHGYFLNCRRLLNLTTAVHHEPVNHLPYQLSIFWALLLTRLAKKSSVGVGGGWDSWESSWLHPDKSITLTIRNPCDLLSPCGARGEVGRVMRCGPQLGGLKLMMLGCVCLMYLTKTGFLERTLGIY